MSLARAAHQRQERKRAMEKDGLKAEYVDLGALIREPNDIHYPVTTSRDGHSLRGGAGNCRIRSAQFDRRQVDRRHQPTIYLEGSIVELRWEDRDDLQCVLAVTAAAKAAAGLDDPYCAIDCPDGSTRIGSSVKKREGSPS